MTKISRFTFVAAIVVAALFGTFNTRFCLGQAAAAPADYATNAKLVELIDAVKAGASDTKVQELIAAVQAGTPDAATNAKLDELLNAVKANSPTAKLDELIAAIKALAPTAPPAAGAGVPKGPAAAATAARNVVFGKDDLESLQGDTNPGSFLREDKKTSWATFKDGSGEVYIVRDLGKETAEPTLPTFGWVTMTPDADEVSTDPVYRVIVRVSGKVGTFEFQVKPNGTPTFDTFAFLRFTEFNGYGAATMKIEAVQDEVGTGHKENALALMKRLRADTHWAGLKGAVGVTPDDKNDLKGFSFKGKKYMDYFARMAKKAGK